MRRLLVLTAVLALATTPLHADTKKAPPKDVGFGRIAWFDLVTTDITKSKDFYAKLLDWKYTAVEGTDLAVEIVSRDLPIGTIRTADGAISQYNGVVYVQVDDIEKSTAKAKELGGTIPPGFPFNLPGDIGAISLLVDPGGQPIGLYSQKLIPTKDKKDK